MENSLIKVLTNIGLNEKEAKVFLACTETGSAPVSTIASAAGINRVTTYDILEKLKTKGLVSYFTKQKIKYFSSTDPEIVLEEFEKRTNDLRSALPKFKRLTGQTSHPRVRYFEGIEGIKTIYADTLTSSTEILNFSNSDEIRKNWPSYDKDYVEKRTKKNIFLKGISPKDRAGIMVHSEDQKYNREIRLIDSNKFDFTNEINIYDDKVCIISFKDELIGMIIESPEIANSQRAIFNICWQFADPDRNPVQSKPDRNESLKEKMLTPLSDQEVVKSLERIHPRLQEAIKPQTPSPQAPQETPKIEQSQEQQEQEIPDDNLSLF